MRSGDTHKFYEPATFPAGIGMGDENNVRIIAQAARLDQKKLDALAEAIAPHVKTITALALDGNHAGILALLEQLAAPIIQPKKAGPGKPKACPHGQGFHCPTCWPKAATEAVAHG